MDTADAKSIARALNQLHGCMEAVGREVGALRHESRNRAQAQQGQLEKLTERVGKVEAGVTHVEGVQQGLAVGLGIAVPRRGDEPAEKPRPTLAVLSRSKAFWGVVGGAAAASAFYKIAWAAVSAAALAVHHALLTMPQ